ncbi:MAG TPA: phosphate acyltransferase PlsX [Stellaceae bacterium]|nr:phosphate acyltransferase PlsX [Stellaceae bacterium]
MADGIVIALDAMGGDHAPESVVNGAHIALKRFPHVHFQLFGDEQKIRPLLAKRKKLARRATVHHTDEAVSGEAKPSQALRSGRRSSMRLAIDAVAEGKAHCVVSAGNTGALMAMAKVVLRTVPGIDRPAMASYFPTRRGESVMLDLGANVECDADNLVQFALLGDVFARTVLGLVQPVVGLLNVGSEELKGHDAVREAAARLRDTLSPISFYGFVEGDDIGAGTVDVIVTDGFTGNIALKTAEGTVKLVIDFFRAAFRHSLLGRIGYLFARGALNRMRGRLDPRKYNGAVFLGLQGIAVKSHGGADALSFANAISVAVDMKANGFLDKIREELARLHAHGTLTKPQSATV